MTIAETTASSPIDVVDPSTGSPVGTARRDDALARGLTVRTVHVFLLDGRGGLLLQQLGRLRDRHPMLWGSSAAAFPRPRESEDSAARRRLKEELGLEIPIRRVGVVPTVDGRSQKFVVLFEGRIEALPAIAEPHHIERVEFWDLEVVDRELARDAEQFTDTFRQVYGWWRDGRRI
jgi:isopentenyl-diphosphate delta-isomerase